MQPIGVHSSTSGASKTNLAPCMTTKHGMVQDPGMEPNAVLRR